MSFVPNLYVLPLLFIIQDYIFTVITVIILRRPYYLLPGLAFSLMRFVDLAVNSMVLRHFLLRKTSTGRWKSPLRR